MNLGVLTARPLTGSAVLAAAPDAMPLSRRPVPTRSCVHPTRSANKPCTRPGTQGACVVGGGRQAATTGWSVGALVVSPLRGRGRSAGRGPQDKLTASPSAVSPSGAGCRSVTRRQLRARRAPSRARLPPSHCASLSPATKAAGGDAAQAEMVTQCFPRQGQIFFVVQFYLTAFWPFLFINFV